MSKAETADSLALALGLAPGALDEESDPAEVIVEFVDALTGNAELAPHQSVVIVMDDCAPDGRLTGVAHVIPAGARRVYAVFENKRSLGGLGRVLAIWRQLGDERLVFTETESIHEGSRYNYVWLDLKEGWPAGRYRVDLHDPARPSLLLASEAFSVR